MTKQYTTRRAARAALSKIGMKALAAANELIREEDQMFKFDYEAAEAIEDAEAGEAPTEDTNEIPAWMINAECGKMDPELDADNPHNPDNMMDSSDIQIAKDEAAQTNDANLVWGYEVHHFILCPHCGIHLSNGVGEHMQEVNGSYIKHDAYQYECLACGGEFGPAIHVKGVGKKAGPRETMKTSLKLDRRIEVNGEVYKNAFQMWKANPTWMTSAQQDALTAKLYAAAKLGQKIAVEINGRSFSLVNVVVPA